MGRDLTLTVFENASHLTVSQCHEHLMRIDELVAKNGNRLHYMESREFFEKQLTRCLKKREGRYDHEQSE